MPGAQKSDPSEEEPTPAVSSGAPPPSVSTPPPPLAGGARGDLFGGLTAAIIALPLALAFGVAAFAPFGPEQASTGALVGLLGAIFTGFFASLFGGTPSQITGPTAPMTVVITAFLAQTVQVHGAENVALVLLLMAFTIMLGGIAQIAVGALGGGQIVKYIPYPVVAGFMNGIAILIFLGQVGPFLGLGGGLSTFEFSSAWIPISVGSATILALLLTRRFSKTIPASLVGLLVGILVYLALAIAGYAPLRLSENPLLVGAIPNPFGSLERVQTLLPVFHLDLLAEVGAMDLRRVATTALTLGILGSIDSLLTSVVADTVTRSRHDSRRELIGQGLGNLISGFMGGLAGAGATVRTLVNLDAGGRTRRSGMLHALVILLVVLLLGAPAGWIPLSALAGILFVTAVNMLDRYSLGLVRYRVVRHEFVIVVAVTAITVFVDLMVAVAIGMAVAAVLFVWQQTRHSVVRRRLRGDEIFSRRVRRLPELELLRAHGHRTLAYELAGALFFGTTDALTSEVEGDLDSADRFIFDFTKVSDVDISGARVLVTIFERLEGSAKQVAVAGLEGLERRNQRVREVLERLDVLRFVAEDDRHTSLDLAFEHLEDDLLEVHMSRDAMALPTPYAECAALMELEPGDREALEAIFHERKAKAGAVLLAEGCEAEQLLLLRAGRVSVFRPGREKETRLSSLGPGTLWGLSGLIPGTFWTNSVRADTDVEYALIEREELDVLRDRDPGLVHRFERVLIRSTVDRLDLLGIELALLEER